MNETTTTEMVPQPIVNLANSIGKMTKGCRFVSLTYTSKKHNETSRYVVLVGISYIELLKKSINELTDLLPSFEGLELNAANEVMESLQKSLEAHNKGTQNEDYTKKGQYIPVSNGININSTDDSIQLFGMIQSKVVLVEGVYKPVKSALNTILKNRVKSKLSVSKFREFALDKDVLLGGRVDGETYVCSENFQPVSV